MSSAFGVFFNVTFQIGESSCMLSLSRRNKHFRYEESAAALALMIDFLQYAAANHDTVIAELA